MAQSFNTNYNVGGDIDRVKEVGIIKEVGRIQGFPTKRRPYNVMYCFDIPAISESFSFDIELPGQEVEVLAITLTCSGYGEMDKYDLFFNEDQWFCDWYCSETKEGLFMGSSTYVYAAPPSSKINLIFKNHSGTSKKVWLGVRMLID